jgi:hypothetical protein
VLQSWHRLKKVSEEVHFHILMKNNGTMRIARETCVEINILSSFFHRVGLLIKLLEHEIHEFLTFSNDFMF